MLKLCQHSDILMAHLFKDKIIKAELEHYDIPDLENKISRVKTWYEAYKNKSLQAKTESQCEQAFNQHFFVEILGYSTFPNESYTLDPKGTADASAQKADAVLGHFSTDKGRVTAVVEIKDVNTSLDRSQRREGNLSPIQQAFKYKPQYKDCAFVIATNFYEIRLFRDNQLDYESFTLDSLVDSSNNYYNFRKFYYLLNAENFVIKHGKSNTEKLLSEIRIEQEKITKEFYRDYKDLRQSLINNLVKNNTNNYDFNAIIEKAQKIIDRIVFICFCEDKDLLPENKLQEVVFHTEKLGLTIPVWDILKGFFKAIDSGSPKLGIPDGYNGELFKEDQILNGMFIDDAICKRFVDFGKYDFSEDLSVNILGHIFEQSITDLEELKGFVEQKEIDKKKSKRKKDGIFYTPDYIVDYIVKNSLGTYLEEKEKEILGKHDLKEEINEKHYEKRAIKAYQEYQDFVRNIKVLDPACGSGAFLVKVFDYLLAENKRIADIIADFSGGTKDLFSSEDYIKNLLENNIYGVDLNPESVEITKLSLWLKTAIKGKKLVSLKGNIKCGNSLIDDPAVSTRAFKWQEEFPEIMKSGGFDIIVGNPPYVRIQNLDDQTINFFNKFYKSSYKNYDIYIIFVEKAVELINEHGRVAFIMPKKFINTDYGDKLKEFIYRKTLLENFLDFGDIQIFEDATTYTGIFIFSQTLKETFRYHKINSKEDLQRLANVDFTKVKYSNIKNSLWIFKNDKENRIFERLNNMKKLSEYTRKIFQGLVTGADDVFILEVRNDKLFSRFTEKEYDFDCEIIKPLLKGSEIKRYSHPKEKFKIIFPYIINDSSATVMTENELMGKYPDIWAYLNECENKLRHREGGKVNQQQWWVYSRTQNLNCFVRPKIITQVLSAHSSLTIDEKYHYYFVGGGTAGGYGIELKENSNLDYKYLLGLLNSKLLEWFIHSYASPFRGGYYAYSRASMEPFPIVETSRVNQQKIITAVDSVLRYQLTFDNKIENICKLLRHEFELDHITDKIENFYEYDVEAFLKALGVRDLNISRKGEIIDFFDKNKLELREIKLEIKEQENIIDDMVFDLYGISEEERQMIMSNQAK